MKKSIFLSGLVATVLCLTACGSKNFNMSFEEALEIANHSEFQNILSQNDNFEQNFDIAGNYDSDWTKVNANLSSKSHQSLNDKHSESSTEFTANITSSWETIKLNGAIDTKLVNDIVYINISSLDLTWSENLAMIEMMIEWFKNQWFSIPMTGVNDAPDTFSVIKDSKELNSRIKDVIINEGLVVYSWAFKEFDWYNAWKFSLDNEKLNELIKEYYDTINSELSGESINEAPTLDIQNFEWYLAITWKDKVTTILENMAIAEDDTLININWFAGDSFKLYLSEGEEDLISLIAEKKGSKYKITAIVADSLFVDGTVSPKLSKSSIDLSFDATLTIRSEDEWQTNIIIPLKWNWGYSSTAEFTVVAPESAQDLTELLWSYLWGIIWWDDYEYDEEYDYEDFYADNEELEEVENEEVEAQENVEVAE